MDGGGGGGGGGQKDNQNWTVMWVWGQLPALLPAACRLIEPTLGTEQVWHECGLLSVSSCYCLFLAECYDMSVVRLLSPQCYCLFLVLVARCND